MNHSGLKRFCIQIESVDESAWAAAQDAMEEDPELDRESMLDSCILVHVVAYQVADTADEALHLAAMACGYNDYGQWSDFFNAGDEVYKLTAVDVSDEGPWEYEWN